MDNNKKSVNEGYQPTTNKEQRGYQPQPGGNYGYQPINGSAKPPHPPTSGSNAQKNSIKK